jgi:UDP-GlcNAc:undecaprenyl-phosphate/decaprenyl-phosphate GlcNAc-1-phosphate transferase
LCGSKNLRHLFDGCAPLAKGSVVLEQFLQGIPAVVAAVQALTYAFFVSSCVCALILWSGPRHLRLTARGHDRSDLQAIHRVPTPRVGGVAVFAGMITALFVLPPEARELGAAALGSSLLLLIAGLREDLSFGASPRARMAAAFLGSLMMIALTGQMIGTSPVPYLQPMLSIPAFGILFTVLAGACFAHACNLVDGLNGLASGYLITFALGIAAVAVAVGDPVVGSLAGVMAAAMAGFIIFNFPRGHIFLGDAGAYVCGHVVAWLGILLLARHEGVSAYAAMLMALWPVSDVLTAIVRRVRQGKSPASPDRLHLHHLVYRVVTARLADGNPRRANAWASVLVAPLYIGPVLTGVAMHDMGTAALVGLAVWTGILMAVRLLIHRQFKILARRASPERSLLA